MIDRPTLQRFASDAGFGANLRNTHAVKLELFALAVARHTAKELSRRMMDCADSIRFESQGSRLGELCAETLDNIATQTLAAAEGVKS